MKTITIQGKTFEYEIFCDVDQWGESFYTEFYSGTETFTRRKYFIFGKKETLTRPKLVFTIYDNIEDHRRTKEDTRNKIEREVELLNRKEEIKRGELI